jgi:RimJ/RimL family protein N-acetyltransferase
MQVFLETDRLVLRRFTSADADNLVSLDADPDVMRFVTGGVPTSREEIENEVLPAFLAYYQRYEGYGFWAVIEKETGEFLGWFHFRPHEDGAPGEVDLGYRLRKSAWGKGYATEGSRALIRKGFTEFGVQRVVAEALAVNQASRRVPEAGADLPSALAVSDGGRRVRRRGIRAGQDRMAAAGAARRGVIGTLVPGARRKIPPGMSTFG